ncbi:MAG: HAD-IC family P-type ATPase [Patescibacteria group bacterium]|nr:HAD-IC family P-type ATPase [Patescibacteria group bacterium]
MQFFQYTNQKISEVFKELDSSQNGLSQAQAAGLLGEIGLNEIKTKRTNLLDVFLRQFKYAFFYLLFFAAVFAFLTKEITEGIVIAFFIVLNVLFGFIQELRANQAAKILQGFIPETSKVLRDGKEMLLDKKYLVPGDIILLAAGDIAPADLRMLKGVNFWINEEVLSGEATPIAKNPTALKMKTEEIFQAKNIIFCGTEVISGEGRGVVVATGKNTLWGAIAKLSTQKPKQSIYEKKLFDFSKSIIKVVVPTIAAIFLVYLISRGLNHFFDFLIFCIALIVSIIPEALPLITTFALSRGALKLAKKNMVVKRLAAIEDLGNIEMLCADKTGTITEGKLTLQDVVSKERDQCFLYALLLSSYQEGNAEGENSFDRAIYQKVPSKIKMARELKEFKKITSLPFDSFRFRESGLFKEKGSDKYLLVVNGAPETVLKLCATFPGKLNKETIEKQIQKKGQEGQRALVVAYKEISKKLSLKKEEKELNFLGYFIFSDPLKKSAYQALGLAKDLGVKIKILTGDSFEVAGAVGKKAGLIQDAKKEVILGSELNSLSPRDFSQACDKFSIFARISPTAKFKIVQALQKKYTVGFLGEGMNDAPALKTADVSLVVRQAADISRENADIILLEKNLHVIIQGIQQGRHIFANINKYIKCVLASNFGNFYSIALISLFLPFLPMLPAQILLANLLPDFYLISLITDRVDFAELKRPKKYQFSKMFLLVALLGAVATVFDVIFLAIFYHSSSGVIQTLWFMESVLAEIVLIFSIRTHKFFLKARKPSIPLVILAILAVFFTFALPLSQLGQKFFQFSSLRASHLLIISILVIGYFIVSEGVKLTYFRLHKNNF